MKIIEAAKFTRAKKKLHTNERKALDAAVALIIENPALGQLKTTDLSGIRVYKFRMLNRLTLLAYTYEDEIITLTLLMFGPHENFYRDLKA